MLPAKKLCSGCGACAAVCPKHCVEMTADREGFRYPVIKQAHCVSCQVCETVCPIAAPLRLSQETTAVAAQNRNRVIRQESSSGGVFSALAEYVLAKGGLVCAAVYDENQMVSHRIIDQPDGIGAMRGAKYAQSKPESCFPRIKKELQEEKYVLFVGTPCQTAGLSQYLGKRYERLILVDMICHGVPSPKVWENYLRERQTSDAPKAGVQTINLRNKETGWSRYSYSVRIQYRNGVEYRMPQEQDWFMRGFVQNLYLRPSCSRCSFKGIDRCSDLTLGDCWGIWDIAPEFDDNQGTSLLLIHSETGQQAWDNISLEFRTYPLSMDQAVAQNPSAICSSLPHPKREQFFTALQSGQTITDAVQACLAPEAQRGVLQKLKEKIGRR